MERIKANGFMGGVRLNTFGVALVITRFVKVGHTHRCNAIIINDIEDLLKFTFMLLLRISMCNIGTLFT